MLLAICVAGHARAEQADVFSAGASQTPTTQRPSLLSEAPDQQPTVHVVLHSLLRGEQREALQESLLWQLQSLNLQAEFTTATWPRPTHKQGGLATLWIVVNGPDWELYVFDGKNTYLRRIERADRDAAVVEAVTVIAQRSLTAIVQGEPPQLERVQPTIEPKPQPKPPPVRKKRFGPSAYLQLSAGYQLSSFAPEVPPASAAVVALQLRLYHPIRLRVAYAYFGASRVSNVKGMLELSRQGASLDFGYWRQIGRFLLGAYAGASAEYWQRKARAAHAGVIATRDTTHIVWVPNAALQVAWFAERSIAPYAAVGVAAPIGAPEFSSSGEERHVLLSPGPYRGSAEVGIAVQFY